MNDQLPGARQRKVFAGALAALLACVVGVPLLSLARCGSSTAIAPPEEFADRITTYEGTDHFTYTFPENDIAFDNDELRFYADDTLYVLCEDGVTDAEKIELAEQVDGTIVGHLDMSRAVLQIHVGDATLDELEEMAEELSSSEAVVRAEPETPIFLSPNSIYESTLSDDPQENVEWAQVINAPAAWEYDEFFGEVTVGVIDTGFQMDHPELDGVIDTASFFGHTIVDDHGTAVASIIGAIDDGQGIRGVASGADGAGNVHIYGVWGAENSIVLGAYNSMGGFAGALRHLAQDDLGHGSPARVINCSMGVPRLEEIDNDTARGNYPEAGWWVSEKDRQKAQKNIAVDSSEITLEALIGIVADAERGYADKSTGEFLLVHSAGNNLEDGLPKEAWMNGFAAGIDENLYNRYVSANGDPGISFAEVHDRTLVVGSNDYWFDFIEEPYEFCAGSDLSDFSCYGEQWVDICAPGDGITAATDSGKIRRDWSGTSFSTPMVAGTAAALWSIEPELTATGVRNCILGTTTKTCSADEDYQYGTYPILDAGAAVESLVEELRADYLAGDALCVVRVCDKLTGEPIEGAKVILDPAVGDIVASVTTDQDGYVKAKYTEVGEQVDVVVTAEGYERQEATLCAALEPDGKLVDEERVYQIDLVPEGTGEVPEQLVALADELGVVPTGTEVFERPGTNSTLTLVPSDRLDGLLGAELYDYDRDGQVELLVAALDAGDGWETGVSASSWNTVDLVIRVYEVAASAPGLADEVRLSVQGLPDEPMISGVQLFRAEVDGETLLYVDSDWVFNDVCASTLALRYTSGGSLEVASGAQRFEHYNSARCYEAVPGTSGADLANTRPLSEEWEGWNLVSSIAWADDGSPGTADMDAYRAVYEDALAGMGLTWGHGRSMFSEDGSVAFKPGYAHPRAGELFQLAGGGEIVELCGVFSTRPESNEGISLEVFDSTGLLDGWR